MTLYGIYYREDPMLLDPDGTNGSWYYGKLGAGRPLKPSVNMLSGHRQDMEGIWVTETPLEAMTYEDREEAKTVTAELTIQYGFDPGILEVKVIPGTDEEVEEEFGKRMNEIQSSQRVRALRPQVVYLGQERLHRSVS